MSTIIPAGIGSAQTFGAPKVKLIPFRRLKKLIKEFAFTDDKRKSLVLGADVRLVPGAGKLALKKGANGYPTTAGLFAKTWLSNPKSAKRWIGFQSDVSNKVNCDGQQVTDVKYRLSTDGASQLFWDGSAWAPATTQWSSEAEVAANISALPIANQSIQVIANLSTTDSAETPELARVKVLYESDIEFQEEYVARSLIPAMRSEIRPIADFAIQTVAGQTELDLNKIETPYKIVQVDSVYNTTIDPNKVNDLLVGYNVGTKIVKWAPPAALNNVVFVRLVYEPVVAIATSQDYVELAKVPALVIESIDLNNRKEVPHGDHVIDKVTGEGWQLKDGFQADIDVTIRFTTDKVKDLDRLSDAVKTFFRDRLFKARGQDEEFRLYSLDSYSHEVSAPQSELHSGRLRARICNAVFYPRDAAPVQAVRRFVVTGGNADFQVK